MGAIDKLLDRLPQAVEYLFPYIHDAMDKSYQRNKYKRLEGVAERLPSNDEKTAGAKINSLEIGAGRGVQEPGASSENIATACVPCALGHVSTSSGLLAEAVRFKGEGLQSNEIIDRVSGALSELNAMERVDLSPAKLQTAPDWEKDLAEEALQKSRTIRHKLESLSNPDDLQQVAADTQNYYRSLNRQWYKRRIGQMSQKEKAQEVDRFSSQDHDTSKLNEGEKAQVLDKAIDKAT